MNAIINKIITASGYSEKNYEGIGNYYSKENNTFFFTLQYSIDEISGLKKYSELAEKDNYKNLLENFNKLVKEGQSNSLEKNSSLIILVKCETLSAIDKYHQQILLLEEDEYFFKKYVILYTDNSVATMNSQENLLNYLHEKLNDEESFSKYAKEGFSDEIADYLMTLQLFIKLPILRVKVGGENFKSLNEKITDTLGADDEVFLNLILDKEGTISNFDFMQEGMDEEIDSILNQLPND